MSCQLQLLTTRDPHFCETYELDSESDWWIDEVCFHFKTDGTHYMFPFFNIIEVRVIEDSEDSYYDVDLYEDDGA